MMTKADGGSTGARTRQTCSACPGLISAMSHIHDLPVQYLEEASPFESREEVRRRLACCSTF